MAGGEVKATSGKKLQFSSFHEVSARYGVQRISPVQREPTTTNGCFLAVHLKFHKVGLLRPKGLRHLIRETRQGCVLRGALASRSIHVVDLPIRRELQ